MSVKGRRNYSANANSNASAHTFDDGECKWCGIREGCPGARRVCQSIFLESQQKRNARARAATAKRKQLRLRSKVTA